MNHRSLWIAVVLAWLFGTLPVYAQQYVPCGSDVLVGMPGYSSAGQHMHSMDRIAASQLRQHGSAKTTSNHITIPVVVHVVHQNGPENLSQASIQQGITYLNDAFANLGLFASGAGIDTDIRFCLAVRDPQGNFTSGINRIQSPLTNMTIETEDASLKALSYWNSQDYFNIWLVSEMSSVSVGSGVAGYATFPASHGTNLDGVVVEARWMGGTQHDAKVLVHEAGHYLGLYHTFQGGCVNDDCLADGDHVCDTPPDGSVAAVPCFNPVNTCSTDADDLSPNNPFRPAGLGGLGDQPDPTDNYMDYGFQQCQTLLTPGQKDRMHFFINQNRLSLLSSLGCITPCTSPVTASFSPSNTTPTAGSTVSFTNLSTGATTYAWYLNGSLFSSQSQPSQTFTVPGQYWVQLVAGNGDPACADSTRSLIVVTCGLQAQFQSNDNDVQPGDLVTFTQQSPGSLSYQWLLDGVPAGTGTSFSHTFNTLGGRIVCLVTDNGTCRDTSCTYISVGDCGRKRNNWWAFGFNGNGINFSSGSPVWVQSTISSASETQASICDRNGAPVLYTNGVKVWRALGTGLFGIQMPRGDSLFGGFAHSSTQGALIVPRPLDDSTYYIFTADESAGWPYYAYGGLSYSVVDLRLPGTGGTQGDISRKNVPLHTPAAEKLAAVRHANGCDVWVLGHAWGSSDFLAFRVGPGGVDSIPVVSSVGFPHVGGFLNTNTPAVVNAQGQMKFSPDGSRVALALQDTAIIEILDFDKATGQLSNPVDYQISTFNGVYGVEFSPDGSKLYFTRPWGTLNVNQIDLSTGVPGPVVNLISSPGAGNGLSLERGPNGKIYGVDLNTNKMFVIHNPNAAGAACNLVVNAFNPSYGMGSGLQTTLADYALQTSPQAHGPLQVCQGSENLSYYFDQYSCTDSVFWELPAGVTLRAQQNGMLRLDFPNAGLYELRARAFTACGNAADTLRVNVVSWQAPDLGPDSILCQGGAVTLNPGSGFSQYTWSTGASSPTITVTQAGWYVVTTTHNGCTGTDSLHLRQPGIQPPANLGPDTSLCQGGVLNLTPGAQYLQYRWQDNSTAPGYTAWGPGTYWVEVMDSCGNVSRDSLEILPDNGFQVFLGMDTVICQGSTLLLSPGQGMASYLWNDNSTQPQLTVSQPGTYFVEVLNAAGCVARDTIQIDLCISMVTGGMAAVHIYPSPSSGLLVLAFTAAPAEPVQLQVLDPLGRTVWEQNLGMADTGTARLDLSHLAAGAYWLRVNTGGESYHGKWIKR